MALIVIAEMFGTSLWLSVNAVADQLESVWQLQPADLGHLTSAVQAGFIVGTFVFAITGLADRYAASRVFAVCAVLGALFNALFTGIDGDLAPALTLRFLTGATLAGIYPIGMKLVIGWAPERAGQMLGWLVGMLVLGTGLPHLVRGSGLVPNWQAVLYAASGLALLAALAVAWIGDGPYRGDRSPVRLGGALRAFRDRRFRAASLGYFGHMWELYAFWALVPFLVMNTGLAADAAAVHLVTFLVFVVGSAACVAGGLASRRVGNARVAIAAIGGSASMCFAYPLLGDASAMLSLALLLVWGGLVVADSPQFSALAAAACSSRDLGGALTLMNSIGFAISIVSIELAIRGIAPGGFPVSWLLLPGPLLGLWVMVRSYGTASR